MEYRGKKIKNQSKDQMKGTPEREAAGKEKMSLILSKRVF